MIRGGANYAYQQIQEELMAAVVAHFKGLLKVGDDFSVAVVGLKIASEHEDDCFAIVQLSSDKLAHKSAIADFLSNAKTHGVSKGAVPNHVVFADIERNFKGAILVKELAKTARAYIDKMNLAAPPKPPISAQPRINVAQNLKLKLIYFDLEGKGEPIRLLCAHAGLSLEDHRLSLTDRTEFDALRHSGELAFGQVPVLQVTRAGQSVSLIQTAAILRYIGKIADSSLQLYPTHPEAAAMVDAVMDQEADTFAGSRVNKYKARFGFSPDILTPDVSAAIASVINATVLPRHLNSLTRIMGAGRWIAKTAQPSVADFCWAPMLKRIPVMTGDPDYMNAYPALKALVDRFYALPAIQTYYQSKT